MTLRDEPATGSSRHERERRTVSVLIWLYESDKTEAGGSLMLYAR